MEPPPVGHSHAHDDLPVTPRVRRLLTWMLVPLALLTLVALVLQWPGDVRLDQEGLGLPRQLARGTVRNVVEVPCFGTGAPQAGQPEPGQPEPGQPEPGQPEGAQTDDGEFTDDQPASCARASVRVTEGPGKGRTVPVEVSRSSTSITVERGTKLVLGYEPDAPEANRYRVIDQQRGRPLALLALLFAVAVVALGRWRGLSALAGLVVSFLLITKFALPALLDGGNPVPIAITCAAAVMFAALYLAHGFSVRTSVAVLGTLASLVLTALLAGAFVAGSHLTGLGTEEATFLGATSGAIDLRGLVLAGIVIGSLGVLDDVTVTQTSAVWELRRANPSYGFGELYRSGVRIGRDHIASTVNTLVLAYAGAALPLLLLLTLASRPLGDVLTSEVVAQEVVRTLVGSIGLVASVPVTTALAAFVASDARVTSGAAGADETDTWLVHLRRTWQDADDTAGTWRGATTKLKPHRRRGLVEPDDEDLPPVG